MISPLTALLNRVLLQDYSLSPNLITLVLIKQQ